TPAPYKSPCRSARGRTGASRMTGRLRCVFILERSGLLVGLSYGAMRRISSGSQNGGATSSLLINAQGSSPASRSCDGGLEDGLVPLVPPQGKGRQRPD